VSNVITSADCTGTAIYAIDAVIANNYIYSSYIAVNTSACTIDGNKFVDNTISIYATSSASIIANTIKYSRQHAIVLNSAGLSTVVGNTIIRAGFGTTPAQYSGVYLNNTVKATVSSNSIIDNEETKTMEYGIVEVGTSDWNLITSCYTIADTMGIYVIGANTEVHSCFNGTSWVT